MNLQAMVGPYIDVVNPSLWADVRRSAGSALQEDFSLMPLYTVVQTEIQVQALSGTELQHVNNLGINGILCAIYVARRFNAVVRKDGKGGDLFTFDGNTWLAVHI